MSSNATLALVVLGIVAGGSIVLLKVISAVVDSIRVLVGKERS